jgi:(p)ppGpp synthase/HD superfamily hydrolase
MCSATDLEVVTEALNDRLDNCRGFILGIFEIERRFIQAVQKSQEELANKCGMNDLSENLQKVVIEIYDKKKFKALSG